MAELTQCEKCNNPTTISTLQLKHGDVMPDDWKDCGVWLEDDVWKPQPGESDVLELAKATCSVCGFVTRGWRTVLSSEAMTARGSSHD